MSQEGGERINLDQKLISDYFKENNYKTAFLVNGTMDNNIHIIQTQEVLMNL